MDIGPRSGNGRKRGFVIKEKFYIHTMLHGINEIQCVCENPPEKCTFAFYVYRDGKDIGHYAYQKQEKISYWAQESGVYQFKVFIRDSKGNKTSKMSPPVQFDSDRIIYCNIEPPRRRFDWLRNVGTIVQEIWVNRKRMWRVSRFSYKVLNQDAYLGSFWNFLNPLIQIATYWFVFGIGLRNGRDVNGYPYIIWMLAGLLPWFFMSQCITQGAGAIRSKGVNALRMRYPIATMPLETVLIALYTHLVMVAILLATFLFWGYFPSVYWLNLIYYVFYSVVFFTALAMVTSVFSMVAIDFQKLINSLIRLLFYITPILWSMENLPAWGQYLLKCNPCLYVVDGFRESLLYHIPFYRHHYEMLFFWLINLALIIWGSNLQVKYKNQFLDLE